MKHCWLFPSWHGWTCQETRIFIITAMITSNLTRVYNIRLCLIWYQTSLLSLWRTCLCCRRTELRSHFVDWLAWMGLSSWYPHFASKCQYSTLNFFELPTFWRLCTYLYIYHPVIWCYMKCTMESIIELWVSGCSQI